MASMQDFFGQLWKEYALSDSRYMFSDPFVLCMETWTAVYTPIPLSFFFLTPIDLMGSTILPNSTPYRQGLTIPPSDPGARVHRAVLR